MKAGFFNFLIDALVAFAVGVLTYLIGKDSLDAEVGSMAAAGFAGVSAGFATCLGYEVGKDDFSARKYNVIAGLAGSIVGGVVASLIGIG